MPARITPHRKVQILRLYLEKRNTSLQREIAEELGVSASSLTNLLSEWGAIKDPAPALESAISEMNDEDRRAAAAVDARLRSKNQEEARRLFNAEQNESLSWGSFSRLLSRAADRGLDGSTPAPPPPGQVIKGLSTMHVRDKETGELKTSVVWTKTKTDPTSKEAAFAEMARSLISQISPAPSIELKSTFLRSSRLLNLYILTDAHIGALATPAEGGDVWKLKEAKRVIVGCFRLMIERAQPAARGVIAFLGDTADYDGLIPVTPRSGHVLSSDSRFGEMVRAQAEIQREVNELALQYHDVVDFVDAEANHDPASSHWRRQMWRMVFANSERFRVVGDNDLPFYAIEHGSTMLGLYHGHEIEPAELPGVFADEFAPMWGRTKYRFIHFGHRHKRSHDGERRGCDLVEEPTLAGRNAWAAGQGRRSIRRARVHTYDCEHGLVGGVTVTPEMLNAVHNLHIPTILREDEEAQE